MTNTIAIVLALAIVSVFVADAYWLHWNLPLFLARNFAALVDYVSFWR
ncbi:hypothetical protein [Paracoccus pacificus]|uniref:Glyceraldehyde-3-phosphate dehydrogenase n=1 Tax=Paracoccus pacificus TaxID=1463598 RepID=A0ABW4R2E9_9RHOB